MAADGKMLINALYHSAVVSIIAFGYSRLGKMLVGGASPKLHLTPHDAGMLIGSVALAMAKKYTLSRGSYPLIS